MGRYESGERDELGFLMWENGERNPYMPSAEELEAMATEAARKEVEKVRDPFEHVRAMRESGLFTDKEVKAYITSITNRVSLNGQVQGLESLQVRVIKANGDLYGHPEWMEPEPEPEPLPTSEELYGGTATVTITNDDGTSFTRPASPEEVKRMRRKEILAIKDPREQFRAIAENRDAFK